MKNKIDLFILVIICHLWQNAHAGSEPMEPRGLAGAGLAGGGSGAAFAGAGRASRSLKQSHGPAIKPPREFSPIRTGGEYFAVTHALVAKYEDQITIKTNGRYIISKTGSSSSFTFFGECSEEEKRRLVDAFICAKILKIKEKLGDLKINYVSTRTLLAANELLDSLESIRSSCGR